MDQTQVQFHSEIAQETVHWYQSSSQSWITRTRADHWEGFGPAGTPLTLDEQWTPWAQCLDSTDHPYVRWFEGAETNAAFNEVDRHVLSGHGEEVAVIEIDEDGSQREISRAQLLVETAVRACELESLGLKMGDRVLLHMSNSLDQLLWIEACKRKAIILSATAIDQPKSTVEARINDLRAAVVLTHASKGAAEKVRSIGAADVVVIDTETLDEALEAHRQRLHTAGEPVSWERICSWWTPISRYSYRTPQVRQGRRRVSCTHMDTLVVWHTQCKQCSAQYREKTQSSLLLTRDGSLDNHT